MKAQVLLIEDSPLNRRLVRDILVARGHEVVEASSVDEARVRLSEHVPDVVLLDVMIPGGGGEAVIRSMRSNIRLRDVPVIAVTALAMPGDKETLLSSGYDGYISKPIDTRMFGTTIESWCIGGGKVA